MIIFLTTIVSMGWGGFALATLWGWFIVPLGVAPINWWQAAGLVTTTSLLTGGAGAYSFMSAVTAMGIEEKHHKYAALLFSIILPAASLFGGWLLKTFGPIVEAAL